MDMFTLLLLTQLVDDIKIKNVIVIFFNINKS